jgi:hypothetical protein
LSSDFSSTLSKDGTSEGGELETQEFTPAQKGIKDETKKRNYKTT